MNGCAFPLCFLCFSLAAASRPRSVSLYLTQGLGRLPDAVALKLGHSSSNVMTERTETVMTDAAQLMNSLKVHVGFLPWLLIVVRQPKGWRGW